MGMLAKQVNLPLLERAQGERKGSDVISAEASRNSSTLQPCQPNRQLAKNSRSKKLNENMHYLHFADPFKFLWAGQRKLCTVKKKRAATFDFSLAQGGKMFNFFNMLEEGYGVKKRAMQNNAFLAISTTQESTSTSLLHFAVIIVWVTYGYFLVSNRSLLRLQSLRICFALWSCLVRNIAAHLKDHQEKKPHL